MSNQELVVRKTWDKEKYQQKATERVQKEEDELVIDLLGGVEEDQHKQIVVRAPLAKRDFKPKIDDKIGTMQVITNSTALGERGGWYCETCDCQLKDSMTYLDHINGKRHQRKLGMSMRVNRATVAGVREKLASLKRKRDEPQKRLDIVERLAMKQDEATRKKAERKRRKLEKKSSQKEGDGAR